MPPLVRALTVQRLLREDTTLRMLRMDSLPLLAGVLSEHLAAPNATVPTQDLHEAMDGELDFLRTHLDLGERTAKAHCDDWRQAGLLLRRPASDARGETYELTPQARRGLRIIEELIAPRATAHRVLGRGPDVRRLLPPGSRPGGLCLLRGRPARRPRTGLHPHPSRLLPVHLARTAAHLKDGSRTVQDSLAEFARGLRRYVLSLEFQRDRQLRLTLQDALAAAVPAAASTRPYHQTGMALERTGMQWSSVGEVGLFDPSAGTSCPQGVQVEWEERTWRSVGAQHVPVRLVADSPEALAEYAGGREAREMHVFADRVARLRALAHGGSAPLSTAIRRFADRITVLPAAEFDRLLHVSQWLGAHPVAGLRPRQLPIRGVDSKWFSAHRSLLTALHGLLHGGSGSTGDEAGTGAGAPRAEAGVGLGIVDADPRVRLRVLDPVLRPAGLEDVQVPVAQAAALTLRPDQVLIVENLEDFMDLCIPDPKPFRGALSELTPVEARALERLRNRRRRPAGAGARGLGLRTGPVDLPPESAGRKVTRNSSIGGSRGHLSTRSSRGSGRRSIT